MPRLNKRAQREQDALLNLQDAAPDGLALSNEEQSGSEPETRPKLGFAAVCVNRSCSTIDLISFRNAASRKRPGPV